MELPIHPEMDILQVPRIGPHGRTKGNPDIGAPVEPGSVCRHSYADGEYRARFRRERLRDRNSSREINKNKNLCHMSVFHSKCTRLYYDFLG